MNFPNLLLVFSSLLGRNDEKNGTWNLATKFNRTVEIHTELNSIIYESSLANDEIIPTTFSSEEIFQPEFNSCHELFTKVPNANEDLRTRNCMCDENCSMYKDCCKDSIYRDKVTDSQVHFTCSNTPLNGNIYMVDKCLSEFTDFETIYKCQTSMNSGVLDISLMLPVTSSRNITYSNSFCAICNNETQFNAWDPVLYYELEKVNDRVISNGSSGLVDQIYYGVINQSMILSNLNVENDSTYVSRFDNLTYKCSILVIVPVQLRSSVRYCRSSGDVLIGNYHSESSTEIYPENVIKLDTNNLPKSLNRDIELDLSYEFCDEMNSHIKTCIYAVAETGDPCLVNSFFLRDTEVIFMENEDIFLKKYNVTFDRTEYTNETSIKNTVYVCGTELPNPKRIETVLKVFLSRLSFCLIILLLIMNANKKKLQSLSDKMTYAYCVTMLLVYGAFEMHRHPNWCLFTEEAMHYFFLSHFVWFLAMSYELWNVICRLSVKFQSTTGKSHTKKFIIYCLVCWITPLPIIPITMYYRRFVNIPKNCPSIPGYEIRKPCLTIPESPIGMYVFFINSIIICVNIFLFVHVCYHIYLTKRRNVKSTSHNNYFELFVKLALTMDLQWFFYVFSFSDIEPLKVVNTMLNASHGLITFLAYGVKKNTFVDLYKKCKSYFDIVQKMRNALIQFFGGVKRPPFLKRTSVEPSTQHTGVDLLSNV